MTRKLFFLSLTLFFVFSLNFHYVFAQSASDVVNNTTQREQLEAQLAEIEKDIKAQEDILNQQKGRTNSLAKEIAVLDATIKKYKLDIKARDIAIQKLVDGINEKQVTIVKLSDKLEKEKSSLSEIIRKTSEIDSYSIIEILLAQKRLSKFFEDLNSFDSIKQAMQKSFIEIEDTKIKTADEKAVLEEKKNDEMELKKLQELQKSRIEEQEAEKSKILKASKGIEAGYQKIIKDKALTASEIRNQIFSLQGSTQIPFSKALEYANSVGAKINLRPAFILGIIAEESNLGKNVGTGNWRIDMKAPRDTEPFLAITKALGIDPDKAPVSKKAWYGYGGAMGPAQFIPSTWVLYGGFKKDADGNWYYNEDLDKVRKALGTARPSDPWNPLDAFMAAAILLKDNGAKNGNFASERLAALRYLAGWTNATKKEYSFYGDDVMNLAAKYQAQIDVLAGN